MTQLSKLEVRLSKIKSDGIASLANLSELKSLKLNGVHCGDSDDITSKDLVDFFSRIKKLEEVEINFHNLNDEVIESLVVNNPNIRHLVLSYNFDTKLTGRSLGIIADNCPQLNHIDIGFSNTQNDDIMQLISGCSKLKYANFEDTRIEDSALARLAQDCPDLEDLRISECLQITVAGIEAFLDKASKAKLKRLDISDCGALWNDNRLSIVDRLEKEYPHIDIVE